MIKDLRANTLNLIGEKIETILAFIDTRKGFLEKDNNRYRDEQIIDGIKETVKLLCGK